MAVSAEKGLWSVAEEALFRRGAFGWDLGGWLEGAFSTPLLETVALAVHFQDVNVVSKPVEQRTREALGAEDFGPLLEG